MKTFTVIVIFMGLLFFTHCQNGAGDDQTNIDSIIVSPACAVINIGGTQQYSAEVINIYGNIIGNIELTWSSSNNAIGTIDNSGLAVGQDGGNITVTAVYNYVTGWALLSINPIFSSHNYRSYEWYRTQMDTGYASNNNCGPASTHMAIKWYRNTTENIPTVETIRNLHPQDGGWWSTTDIMDALRYYGIPFATHGVNSINDILNYLRRGSIVILCMEMKWITYNRHDFYDRFYTYDRGHFLVVKGWSQDQQYMIVYDPNSWGGDYYSDGTMMGRNRYYKSNEVLDAVSNWWAFLIEIGAPSVSSTVNPAHIPVGRAGSQY